MTKQYMAQMMTVEGRWENVTEEPDTQLATAEERAEYVRRELQHSARVVDADSGVEVE